MAYRKKLIEVSLPLEAINEESAREKSIRHGHPSTLHLWWARRPLAACRAVLWSSLVDDPSEYMPDEESANRERDRLFSVLEKLVEWENINNEDVLDAAKLEIARSIARDLVCEVPVGKEAIRQFLLHKAPPVLDPFAGGGSIPLEAQRLGLRSNASDLNPVAVLINKALIEIPPKFAGMTPIHPPESGQRQETLLKNEWDGLSGLVEDIRYYGKWIREEAEKSIGHLYPKVRITEEMLMERDDLRTHGVKVGEELNVIAWLWARTVKCPNPACGADMPLIGSMVLSTKKGNQVHLEPRVTRKSGKNYIDFTVRVGLVSSAITSKVGRGAQFRCLACEQISSDQHIRTEFKGKRTGLKLTAIVVERNNTRLYIPGEGSHQQIMSKELPLWHPEEEMNVETSNLVSGRGYGIQYWHELFTTRQLIMLSTYCDLIQEVRHKIQKHAEMAHVNNVNEYIDAIATYLGLAVSKLADYNSSYVVWSPTRDQAKGTFARQALPMVWDFAEVNSFAEAAGDFSTSLRGILEAISNLPINGLGESRQGDATALKGYSKLVISTDPPYYDNICYADLSDYFYIWQRHALGKIYPDLFATMLVPKSNELVAAAYRFNGDSQKAESFFEDGLRKAFANFKELASNLSPITVYYAFKQSEEDELPTEGNSGKRASTGWETMLSGLITSGFQVNGTWPIRTERESRTISLGTNALASSIVLVCRPRDDDAPTITRRELLAILKRELPTAFQKLQQGNIAPVDLAQAAIGPGMAIFSRYKAVLEADGSAMRVRAALTLINQSLDEFLAEQEGEYDSDTRWSLAWFEQYGHDQGSYGVAETLSKAKNTSVEGLSHAGFLEARAGKVRLLKRDELDRDWDPTKDKRLTAWEAAQYLIRSLDKDGEKGAGVLLSKLGTLGETARDLAYRLYTICERKGWAQEALAYNMLVVAWPRIKEQSGKGPRQESLL